MEPPMVPDILPCLFASDDAIEREVVLWTFPCPEEVVEDFLLPLMEGFFDTRRSSSA
jgi:hypothetical protein